MDKYDQTANAEGESAVGTNRGRSSTHNDLRRLYADFYDTESDHTPV